MEIELSHTNDLVPLNVAYSPPESLVGGSAVRPTILSLRNTVHPILGSHLPTRTTQRSHSHALRTSNSSSYNQSSSLRPSLPDNASTATENDSSLHSRSYNSHSETMEKIRQEKLRLAQLEFQRRQQEKEQKLHDSECRQKVVRERKENLLKEKQKEKQRLNEEKHRQVIERRQKQEEVTKVWRAQVLQRTQQPAQKRTACMTQTPTSGVWSSKRPKKEESRVKSQSRPASGHYPVAFGSSTPRSICESFTPHSTGMAAVKRCEGSTLKNSSSKATNPIKSRDISAISRQGTRSGMSQSMYVAPTNKDSQLKKSATWSPKQSPRAQASDTKRCRSELADNKAKMLNKSFGNDKRRISLPPSNFTMKNTNPKRPIGKGDKPDQKARDFSVLSKSTYNASPIDKKNSLKHDTTASPKRNLNKRGSLPMSTSMHAFTRNKDSEEETTSDNVDELMKYRAKMAEVRRLAAERREMARMKQEVPKVISEPEPEPVVQDAPSITDEPKSVSSEQSNRESAFFETADTMSLVNSDTDFSLRSDEESLPSSGLDVTSPQTIKQEMENSQNELKSESAESIIMPTDTPLASMTNSLITTGAAAEEQKMLEQQEREERKRKILSIMSRVKTQNPSNAPLTSSPTETADEKPEPIAPTHKFTRVDSLPCDSTLRSPMTTSFIAMSPTLNFNSEARRHSEAVPVTTPTTQFKSTLLQNLLANRRLSAGAHILPTPSLSLSQVSKNPVEEQSKTENNNSLPREDKRDFSSPNDEEVKSSETNASSEDNSFSQTTAPESPGREPFSGSSASPLNTLPNITEERPEDIHVVEVAS